MLGKVGTNDVRVLADVAKVDAASSSLEQKKAIEVLEEERVAARERESKPKRAKKKEETHG